MKEPGRRVPARYSRTSLFAERKSWTLQGVSNAFGRVYLNVLSTEYSDSFGRRCLGERFLYGLRVCRLRSNRLLVFFVRVVASPIFEVFHHTTSVIMEPALSLFSGLSPRLLCPFGSKETMLGCKIPSVA